MCILNEKLAARMTSLSLPTMSLSLPIMSEGEGPGAREPLRSIPLTAQEAAGPINPAAGASGSHAPVGIKCRHDTMVRDLRSAAPGIRSTGCVRIAEACTAWLGALNLLRKVNREACTQCSGPRRVKSSGRASH